MSQMKKLVLVRGIPGSGKTTFADFLLDFLRPDLEVHSYSGDDYFTDADGNYNFDASKLGAAHKLCQARTESAMSTAASADSELVVLVHNTFTTEKEMKPYLDLAKQYNFEVTSLIVENRHGHSSVHGVPEETLVKMKARFSVNI